MRPVNRSVRYLSVLAALAAWLTAAVPAEPAHADLSGAWRLNHSASDTGGAPSQGGGPGVRHHGGGMGGPGGGGYGGRGGHGGGMGGGDGYSHGGDGGDREEMRDRMERVRALFEPVERLTITSDGDVVTLVDGDGRTEKLVADGKREQHLVGNTQAELKTTWQEGRLVSEIDLGGGSRFRRSLGVDTGADGVRHLTIQLEAEGGRGGDRPPLKRVYDLME